MDILKYVTLGILIEYLCSMVLYATLGYMDYYSACSLLYTCLAAYSLFIYKSFSGKILLTLALLAIGMSVINLTLVDKEMFYVLYDWVWGGVINYANLYRGFEVFAVVYYFFKKPA